MEKLSIFANFFIDNDERLQRMKDSYQSMKPLHGLKWLVNVRGSKKTEAAAYLKIHGIKVFNVCSGDGWFHDSKILSEKIDSEYVFLWIEDHICLRPEKVRAIVDEMHRNNLDIITYTFWNQGQMRRRYENTDIAHGVEIDWFEHTIKNNHIVQCNEGGSYLVSYASIMKTVLFKKILFENKEFKWPKETPFDFEIDPRDVQWLPLRRAIPKYEIFASIDDDHGCAGYCLQSRGLYPIREGRKSYANQRNLSGWFLRISRKMGVSIARYLKYRQARTEHASVRINELQAGCQKGVSMPHELYTSEFYRTRDSETNYAARKIISLILNTLPPVQSAIDIGCGVGTWLSVLKEFGVKDICGLDGYWVDKQYLVIPNDCFQIVDLKQPIIEKPKKYDLALCLEVAEHLPETSAKTLVESLVNLSDFVLFSAAIPQQGGVGHKNEQWQGYWAEIFQKLNYIAIDMVRPNIWNDANIYFWYRQNIILYVHKDRVSMLREVVLPYSGSLVHGVTVSINPMLSVVHPDLYATLRVKKEPVLKKILKKFISLKFINIFTFI